MTEFTFKLNTGATIPALGLGTWQSPPGEVKSAVYHALKSGYRHIDCAFVYQNEEEVGAGLKKAFDEGVCKRSEVFITTKLWCSFHNRPEENLDISLQKLGQDYVDLYLMHWPLAMNPQGSDPIFPKLPDGSRDILYDWSHIKTYRSMEELLKTGKAKAIGVSNYSKKYLEELLSQVDVVPAANQIENHPLLPQQEIVDYCKEKGILVEAYSPLGSTGSPLMKDPAVLKVAEQTGVSPGCVLLSYHVARGSVVLPKSVTPSRIEENMKIVKLDSAQLDALESIHKKNGLTRFVYPPFGINFGFPDKNEGKVLSS